MLLSDLDIGGLLSSQSCSNLIMEISFVVGLRTKRTRLKDGELPARGIGPVLHSLTFFAARIEPSFMESKRVLRVGGLFSRPCGWWLLFAPPSCTRSSVLQEAEHSPWVAVVMAAVVWI